jgi:virulence-associated protein VapD
MGRRIVRQGIHFDMNTKALKKHYPKDNWRRAYDDVRSFFESNGFEHEQGSGYHSKEEMTQPDALKIIDKMILTYPWLNQCVRICTIADVPVMFDISYMFEKEEDYD